MLSTGDLMKFIFHRLSVFSLMMVLLLSPCHEAFPAPLKKPLSFQHFTQKDGLTSEMVYAVAVKGDEVWFGTYGGGTSLYLKSKKTWKAYTTKGEPQDKADDGNSIHWKNLLAYNHVSVILPDEDRIWFGTYFYGFGGGGISYYDPQKKPPWKRFNTHNGKAKKVVSLAVDGDQLWIGSEKGLSLLDKKSEQWRTFYSTQHGLSGNFVNALLIDSDVLWAGTNGGITRFHRIQKTWKSYGTNEGLIELEIKSLAKVGEKIWAGSIQGTLLEYDSEADRWKKIESSDPLDNGGIYAMLVTKDRTFVCRDNGVSVYDLATGQSDAITASDGLLSSTVFSAAEDKNDIWFGTDKGVSKLFLNP
jgi:ligand-binding sensor domain-containing protein